MGWNRTRHALVMTGALQALIHPALGCAEEMLYRMVPSTLQQSYMGQGSLRTEPALRFVEMVLVPANGHRGAPYEHRFPSPGASPATVRLSVREVAGIDQGRFVRKHRFEHNFRRIVVYWGCGENAGPGQPRLIYVDPEDDEHLSRSLRLNPERLATSESIERVATVRGTIAGRDVRWPQHARMAGTHELRLGSASPRFDVEAAAEPLPSLTITQASAEPNGPIRVSWRSLPQAGAYFANVFVQRKLSRDVVIWTSSRIPEGGWLLYKTHPGTEMERLRASGVLLPRVPIGAPSPRKCAVIRRIRSCSRSTLMRPRSR